MLDQSVKADFEAIAKLSPGDLSIPSRDLADERWIVAFTRDDGPTPYYAWDRKAQKGTFSSSTSRSWTGSRWRGCSRSPSRPATG